jgi:hypothetical protein
MKEIALCSQAALKVIHVMFFSRNRLVLTIPCQMVRWSVTNANAHCYKSRLGRLFYVTNLTGFDLLHDNATQYRCLGVQNLVQRRGWEMLTHPTYSPDLASCKCWLFACMTEHLWGKQFGSEDDNKTAVSALITSSERG